MKSYGRPMFFSNEEHCLHDINKWFNTEAIKEELNPELFDVYHSGKFNEETGKFTMLRKLKLILNCSNLEPKEKTNLEKHNEDIKSSESSN